MGKYPDPQYAIMLRGAWGWAKRFYPPMDKATENDKDADKLKWRPDICKSLYGFQSTTQQITEQIT